MELVLVYLFIINAISYLLMLIDKKKAQKKRWRIPERILLATAIGGGSFGCLLGMFLCHHKTKHLKFQVSIPLLFLAQSILLLMLHNL